ncbi:hypothetical protein [Nocardia shimofusensis]|uniref:hypothetical protein n=1 Tax=Nocardia shimofusensis TaxID=228596 RepID=UPI00082AB368|nr:hypothetical protein [Nocardia shimofusensis]
MERIAGWWDGFELWVAGLPFIPQFFVVLVGMVPVSFAIAYLLDRGLRAALRILGRDRGAGSTGSSAAGFATVEPSAEAMRREPAGSGAR